MSRTLHVLIHLGRHMERATSETISKMLNTNPVVVRRTLGGLRENGLVTSEKGHHGGWSLNRELGLISLLDVYEAIGRPSFFAIGPSDDNPECLVEQAVDAQMAKTLGEAEALMLARFAQISVADVAADFEDRLADVPLADRPSQVPEHAHVRKRGDGSS
jgi:DNA-binding IscR family transcriptional regulator